MFGIGMQELAIIFVVALLIFGPKRLPELARTLGKGMAEFRRASNDLRQSFSLDDPPSRPPPTGPSRRTDIPPDPRLDRDYTPPMPSQVSDAPLSASADDAPLSASADDAPLSASADETTSSASADDETVSAQTGDVPVADPATAETAPKDETARKPEPARD